MESRRRVHRHHYTAVSAAHQERSFSRTHFPPFTFSIGKVASASEGCFVADPRVFKIHWRCRQAGSSLQLNQLLQRAWRITGKRQRSTFFDHGVGMEYTPTLRWMGGGFMPRLL